VPAAKVSEALYDPVTETWTTIGKALPPLAGAAAVPVGTAGCFSVGEMIFRLS